MEYGVECGGWSVECGVEGAKCRARAEYTECEV